MQHLIKIYGFGWIYLRRYWVRFLSGVLMGVLFGLLNASFVWATKTIFERLDNKPPELKSVSSTDAPAKPAWHLAILENVNASLTKQIDPWLPKTGRGLDWKQILGGLLFFPLLVALWSFAGYLSSYCLAWVSERVVNDLRLDVLAKLNTLSLDFFNRSTMGNLLTHINGDTMTLHQCLSYGLSDLVKEPMTIISVFFGLCLIDWKLTLITTLFVPLCMIPLVVLGRKVQRASKSGLQATITQSSLMIEALSSIRIVKAFNLEKQQEARYRQLSRDMIHHAMKRVQAAEMVNPLIQTISMLGLGFLIVYIFYTHTNVPQLVSFLTGVVIFFTPVKKLARLHILFQQTRIGVERMISIMSEQPTVKEPEHPQPLTGFHQSIRLENVSFSYGSTLVLRDINFEIPRGTKLGIAGESGSGKSTLVNLLFRFYDPTAGAIKIDGVDLREFAFRDIRQVMALVSQEVMVFDQSVSENISSGKTGATQMEIEEAAKGAYAHDFILSLPEGYNTRIGERGVSLSGGQRQRVAIARAFIRNAPILVLDEATASLDSQAEAEVQTAIDRLAENRTVICVAHRLSTLASMDRVIVLSQGRIVEDGAFEDLLRKKGLFAEMARRQGIVAGIDKP